MRISNISLRNVRLFGEQTQTITFDREKNIAILLGDNGSGKSTVLDVASILLSNFVGAFPRNAEKKIADDDVHIDNDGQLSDYLQVSLDLQVEEHRSIHIMTSRRGLHKGPQSEVKEIKAYAEELQHAIENDSRNTTLPLLAYYGTWRGQIKAPERKRGFQKVFAWWDCYSSALQASTDFKRFFAWYDMMEDEERRERERRLDFSYQSPVLNCVRQAIEAFVGEQYSHPHIDIHPLRFVLEEKVGNNIRELRLEQLSDGYKIVIAMVADMASRMAEGNPEMINPLEADGVVLIDEIDLHLHPLWQRSILLQLSNVFPNVQFIVTTHSPIMLLGAYDIAQVIRLDGCMVEQSGADYSNYDVGQLLLSELFGMKSILSPHFDADIAEQNDLLKRYADLSPQEHLRLADLDRKLAHTSCATSLDDMKLKEYIYQLGKKMNVL